MGLTLNSQAQYMTLGTIIWLNTVYIYMVCVVGSIVMMKQLHFAAERHIVMPDIYFEFKAMSSI